MKRLICVDEIQLSHLENMGASTLSEWLYGKTGALFTVPFIIDFSEIIIVPMGL